MNESLDLILDNIKIVINKIEDDKINESENLINKIIKLINQVEKIINQIKWNKSDIDKLNIDKEDLFEIQKIIL